MKTIHLIMVMIGCLLFSPVYAGSDMKEITIHTLTGEEAGYDESTQRMGVMVLNRKALFTIEQPWLPNLNAPDSVGGGIPYRSAVPPGEYDLVLRDSPSRGVQWHFVNTDLHVYLEKQDRKHDWERFSCMFHTANYVNDVGGCIGPGSSLADINADGTVDVANSGRALLAIKRYLDGESLARLRIV